MVLIGTYLAIPYLVDNKPLNRVEAEKQLTKVFEAIPPQKVIKKPTRTFFNPNLVSEETLVAYGFPEKLAQTTIHFREKIGSFQSKEDLKKIYGMDSILYQDIEPYLIIEEQVAEEEDKKSRSKKKKTKNFFQFNPNTVTEKELLRLGLSEKQVSNWLKFREKGGVFKQPEDIAKIYSLKKSQAELLLPYVIIEEQEERSISKPVYTKEILKIALNTAEQEDLMQINGIGEKLSLRILKYRDKLGGFYSISQLKEVYGLDSTLIEKNQEVFVVDVSQIQKIKLNSTTIQEMIKHPYISYYMAKRVINFRDVHGLFKTVDEIWKNDLVKEEEYSKIVYYLSVE